MNTKVGNFFVSIGRGIKKGFFGLINWIKTTAWIQPLLIVAVILGIILCIKPVGSLIGNLFNPDTTYQFYRQHTADMDDVLTVMNKEARILLVRMLKQLLSISTLLIHQLVGTASMSMAQAMKKMI